MLDYYTYHDYFCNTSWVIIIIIIIIKYIQKYVIKNGMTTWQMQLGDLK